MTTEEKLTKAKIETEDIIADLERLTAKIRRALIREPPRQIHAASPELFEVAKALASAHRPLWEVKAQMLRAIGMNPKTELVPGLFQENR